MNTLPTNTSSQAEPDSLSIAATRPMRVNESPERQPSSPAWSRFIATLTGNPVLIVQLYLLVITLAEFLTTISAPAAGLILHGLVMAALIIQSTRPVAPALQRIYLTLALAPLIRLVSLSIPLQHFDFSYWYLIVGAPLLISVFMVNRYCEYPYRTIGFTLRGWFLQLLIGFIGLGLGYLEYLILRPQPLVASFTLQSIWLPALILVVFTGFLEEFIFRGVMQRAFGDVLGRWRGMLYVSAIFAVLHIGYQSLLDVLFVFGVAVLFGFIVIKTGSILGVTLAHGLTNVSLFLLFPFLLAAPLSTPGLPALQVEAPLPTLNSPSASPLPAPSPSASELLIPDQPAPVPTLQLPAPIVVDDGDDAFIRTGGLRWKIGWAEGGDLVWATARSDGVDTTVEWRPVIPVCGEYLLEVFIPGSYATTQSARYGVGHAFGQAEVIVSQAENQMQWVAIGSYIFDPGQPAYLRLDNQTFETESARIVFDAARWTWLDFCE